MGSEGRADDGGDMNNWAEGFVTTESRMEMIIVDIAVGAAEGSIFTRWSSLRELVG